MDKLTIELTSLIRRGTLATCKTFFNLSVTDFTAASVETSSAPGAGSGPAREAVPLRGITLMDLNAIISWSVLLFIGTSDVKGIK